MYVYKVSAIVDYLPFLELSYFSGFIFYKGDIVEVSFGNRKLLAVVLNKENIENAKTDVRNANFKTQKIISKAKIFTINQRQFEKMNKFSKENFISFGELLYYLFWDIKLKDKSIVSIKNGENKYQEFNLQKLEKFNSLEFINLNELQNINIYKLKTFDKYTFYKEAIFEAIKLKQNILIIFSDEMSLLTFKVYIKHYNLKQSKNIHIYKVKEAIKIIQDFDLNNIKIDNLFFNNVGIQNNINIAKPHVNQLYAFYFILNFYAKSIDNINLFIDKFIDIENIFANKNIIKSIDNIENTIIKKYFVNKIMPEEASAEIKKQNKIEIVSEEIINIIKQKLENKKQIFIFVLNHGYTLRIYCSDCNTAYACPKCTKPMALDVGEHQNHLYCKDCANKIEMKENQLLLCKKCGSFNFDTFGIGIKQVYDYLKNKIDTDIIYFDESEKKLLDKNIIQIIVNQKESISKGDGGGLAIGSLRTLYAFTDFIDMSVVINLGDINSDNLNSINMHTQSLNSIENRSLEMCIQRTLSDSQEKNLEKDKHDFWNLYKQDKLQEFIKTKNNYYKIITVTTAFINKKYLLKLNDIFSKSGEYVKNKQLVNYFMIPNFKYTENTKEQEKENEEVNKKIFDFISYARNFADVYVGDSVREFTFIKVKR